MLSKRRINLYAGPGTGKTTTAADVFSRLKNKFIHEQLDTHVELVQEYVKVWAWENRKPKGFDQIYICAQQMRKEEIPLRNGVDLIVTDSPLFMQCCYAKKYETPYWEELYELVHYFEEEYPSIHIFLDRGERPYVAKGRYQTSEEAKELDKFILDEIKQNVKETIEVFKYNEVEKIVDHIIKEIK